MHRLLQTLELCTHDSHLHRSLPRLSGEETVLDSANCPEGDSAVSRLPQQDDGELPTINFRQFPHRLRLTHYTAPTRLVRAVPQQRRKIKECVQHPATSVGTASIKSSESRLTGPCVSRPWSSTSVGTGDEGGKRGALCTRRSRGRERAPRSSRWCTRGGSVLDVGRVDGTERQSVDQIAPSVVIGGKQRLFTLSLGPASEQHGPNHTWTESQSPPCAPITTGSGSAATKRRESPRSDAVSI